MATAVQLLELDPSPNSSEALLSKRTITIMVASAAALWGIVGVGPASATSTTHARPATTCTPDWTNEGAYGTVSVVDGNGNTVTAGTVDEQYDYCGHIRAAFFWNPTFRTTAHPSDGVHPGINGAWVNAINQSYTDLGANTGSGFVGSLAGPAVPSPVWAYNADGSEEWSAGANLKIVYSNGETVTCLAWSQTWDYSSGKPINGVNNKTCKP